MTENIELIVIVVLVGWLWMNRDPATNQVQIKFPPWLWRVIGIFLLVMLVRHFTDALSFLSNESDNWWPLVKKSAGNMMAGLRHLFSRISG